MPPASFLLQWERKRNDSGPQYLENLEAEWQRRNLCSECLRGLDHPFMTEVDDLHERAERAERQIAGINDAARLPDAAFKLAVLESWRTSHATLTEHSKAEALGRLAGSAGSGTA